MRSSGAGTAVARSSETLALVTVWSNTNNEDSAMTLPGICSVIVW